MYSFAVYSPLKWPIRITYDWIFVDLFQIEVWIERHTRTHIYCCSINKTKWRKHVITCSSDLLRSTKRWQQIWALFIFLCNRLWCFNIDALIYYCGYSKRNKLGVFLIFYLFLFHLFLSLILFGTVVELSVY